MSEKSRKILSWVSKKADTTHAQIWLVALSFTESSIFIVPPDPLLAAMVFVRRDKWLRYTIITATASIAGAIFGYIIGAILFDTVGSRIISFYSLEDQMEYAMQIVRNGVFVFTLTMAFTPLPFKVGVLAAGFTKSNFIAFIVATIGGRFARYTFVSYITKVFGENSAYIMKRFWWYATAGGILILLVYFTYKYFFI